MTAGLELSLAAVSVRHATVDALLDVDLEVGSGECVGLVGPSGAGKTTLLRLFNATARPTRGSVLVDGVDLATLSLRELRATRARVGFVPQDYGLVPNVRVLHNVLSSRLAGRSWLWAMRALAWPSRAQVEEAHALLERVGIGDKIYQRTDRLSGGQRQRVAIARTLYQRPAAILADEPVASVDPARARDTVDLLLRLSQEQGITLCMSLHDLGLARASFARLVGLRAGRVVFDAAPADVSEAGYRSLFDLSDAEMLADGA